MKRLLWIGDATVPTGLACVTHSVLEHLKDQWEVHVLGINYHGDPHQYPYRIYPACRLMDQDMWGVTRYRAVVEKVKPDVICILHDTWNVCRFLKMDEEEEVNATICAYMAVDAYNLRTEWCKTLNRLHTAMFYTEFGKEVALSGGYSGEAVVIPHGVNLDTYPAMEQNLARETLGLGKLKGKYVVGNVAQNQVRKRLDLTIRYFYLWLKEYDIRDAWLYVHAKSRGVIDLPQLADYYERTLDIKPRGRLILLGDPVMRRGGLAENYMRCVYNSMDVQMSTCGGEGWGLPVMEAMACGTPNIVPEFGALAEWTKGACEYVPCTMTETWEYNTIGHLPGEKQYLETLDKLYRDRERREFLALAGKNLVSRPFFRWENIAKKFDKVLARAAEAKPAQNRVLKKVADAH